MNNKQENVIISQYNSFQLGYLVHYFSTKDSQRKGHEFWKEMQEKVMAMCLAIQQVIASSYTKYDFYLDKITEKIDSVTGFRIGIFQRHTTNMIFIRATVEHCYTVDPRYLDFGYLE